MSEVCSFIESWNSITFQLCTEKNYLDQNDQRIMKDIENIRFNKVKIMNISNNKIQSFEALNRILMPEI